MNTNAQLADAVEMQHMLNALQLAEILLLQVPRPPSGMERLRDEIARILERRHQRFAAQLAG